MKHSRLLASMILFLISCSSSSAVSFSSSPDSGSLPTSSDSASSSSSSNESSSYSSVASSSSISSSTSSEESSYESSLLLNTPEVIPLSDSFDIDNRSDLRYELNAEQTIFVGIEGYGIRSSDYSVSGNILTLSREYLKYFPNVASYTLQAVFTYDFQEIFVPFEFDIVCAHRENRIINGDFETGNYFGWNSYPLWKDESGLVAFQNERIVATSFYGSSNSNPYNREGQFHLGVYGYPYTSTSKDINQERMGMLRSSDFILGGAGWISFRMGGGPNSGTAYVSIKESGTNIELARYGNRHFGNTSLSQTMNAEAYMFQYYADLSSYLGTSMYVLISDAASHEWNVLALDNVQTYLEIAPLPPPEQLAVNIKPNISGIGENNNDFSSHLNISISGWENPQDVFRFVDGRAQSNRLTGDGDLGVLRSPAFRIAPNGNHFLTFEWEGAIMYDKQLFVLVKEVATNIEVLRLTRRDNLYQKSGGGFDKHYYDLGGLDVTKEYYIELVDNIKSSWGLISVKNVFLVNQEDSRVQVASDAATNTYYGHARVDFATGGHRVATDFSYEPLPIINKEMTSLGENGTQDIIISYHTSSSRTWVEYTYGDGPIVYGIVSLLTSNPENIYRLHLEGLSSDRLYQYRICEFGVCSSWKAFSLPNPAGFSFIFAADSQSNSLNEAHILNRLLTAAIDVAPASSFVLMSGDIVERGANSQMWDWFFETTKTLGSLPFLMTTGNHDYYDAAGDWANNDSFEQNIPHPDNGISNYSSYYVKIGTTLIVMLDAVNSTFGVDQQTWLVSVIEANAAEFIIVATHYSAYGTYHETTSSGFRASWTSTFEDLGVNLVISGHDHLYTRTAPMYQGATVDQAGVIYLTGGSASAKIYDLPEEVLEDYDFALTSRINVVTIFTINEDGLLAQAINQSGQLIDSFQIQAD